MLKTVTGSKLFKVSLVTIAIFITWVVFNIRLSVGAELAVSPLFLIPIALLSMYIGKWAGVAMGVFSSGILLYSDYVLERYFGETIYLPAINELLRLLLFIFTAVGLSELNGAWEREKGLARVDYLTEIGNRRLFYEVIQSEIDRDVRYRHPFSVAYLDVDNFKSINDLLGHERGDDFLTLVAMTIKKYTRKSDAVARLGGDEFGILLPEADAEAAAQVVSKLQSQLLLLAKKLNYQITFSFGVVTYHTIPNSVDEVLKKSDSLMYEAKKSDKHKTKHEVIE